MSDERFQRPGESPRPTPESWPYVSPLQKEKPTAVVAVSMLPDHEDSRAGKPTSRPAGFVRFRRAVAASAVALLVGVSIGALAIDRPTPAATPITVDSFPREVLGQTREDVGMRDGGSEAVTDRLDAQFQDQLAGYRFAYGGEGANFAYGESMTLTIVNGQLATEVPILSDSDVAGAPVISLNTRDTTCASSEIGIATSGSDEGTRTPLESVDEWLERQQWVFTDCVLFDKERNLALRLTGVGPSEGILKAAGQFRDELERIHAELIA